MDAIYKRRSIRKFTDKQINDEDLKKILKAGMNSPSAENNQEWEFIVITDKELKNKIYEKNQYAFSITTAPIAILICADMNRVSDKEDNFWVQDLSASSQNMLTQATELKIGSIWHGLYQEHKDMMRKLLGLPKNIEPLNLLAFGYSSKEREANDRYLEERIHYNKF